MRRLALAISLVALLAADPASAAGGEAALVRREVTRVTRALPKPLRGKLRAAHGARRGRGCTVVETRRVAARGRRAIVTITSTADALTVAGRVTHPARRLPTRVVHRACGAGPVPTPAGPPATPAPTATPTSTPPPVTPEAPPAGDGPRRFAVTLEGDQRYSWMSHWHHTSGAGTDSECTLETDGKGAAWLHFATDDGVDAPGTAYVTAGGVTIPGSLALGASLSREGAMHTTQHGANADDCPDLAEASDASGCISHALPTMYANLSVHGGFLMLELSSYDPRPDLFSPCPLDFPGYGDPLDDGLESVTSALIDTDALATATRPVFATAHLPETGHEDCGSEDGPGCARDTDYVVDATKSMHWTATFKPR